MQKKIEEIRLQRQEDYEQKLKEGRAQANSSSNEIGKIRYRTTKEELEAIEAGPIIIREDPKWKRRQGLIEPSRLCQQVCQIQVINEPSHEGTCSIKDVGIDTIHTFTKSLE